MMTDIEAIYSRHSVRNYLDKPIESDKIAALNELISECNEEGNLHLQLLTDAGRAFNRLLNKAMGLGSAPSLIACVGRDDDTLDERVGYYGEKIVLLLDFETIIAEVNPEINAKLTTFEEAEADLKERRSKEHIVIAEDSPMLRDLLTTTLHESGYNYVKPYSNGKEAWDYLEALAAKDAPVESLVRLVVTDIEMPQMDGHRLLKLIRSNNRLHDVPVVLFSSLINEEMRRKGDELGANGQIAKPEINQLIGLLDDLIFGIKKKKED